MVERTLVFIKPDGVERGLVGKILFRFEQRGLTLIELKKMMLSSALADKHYEEHLAQPFYPALKSYVTSGPIVVFVLEGERAISIVRKMCGVTDSAEADSGTIRGDFAVSKSKNIIHSSDSSESAAREIANFGF